MRTKDFLLKTGISESTLRRWLRDGHPIPELTNAPRDWRGNRDWSEDHVRMVKEYKNMKIESLNFKSI